MTLKKGSKNLLQEKNDYLAVSTLVGAALFGITSGIAMIFLAPTLAELFSNTGEGFFGELRFSSIVVTAGVAIVMGCIGATLFQTISTFILENSEKYKKDSPTKKTANQENDPSQAVKDIRLK